MNDILPSISFVIPTFNSERVLDRCLESIRLQDYMTNKIEIIIVDAASTDKTLDIAKKYQVDKVLDNPLQTGEAGKAIGINASSNEIIALIDSDNLLDGKDWLKKMVKPFKNPEIVSSEAMFLAYKKEDHFIDRYCALIGMNDPMHLFIGNYDRFSYLTGKWTGLPIAQVDQGEYIEVILNKGMVPTMGANGYLVRKEALGKTKYEPYYFDIDIVYQLVLNGYNRLAMVKVGIVHLFCSNIKTFVRKQGRRINDYLFYRKKGLRVYNHGRFIRGYITFIMCTLLLFPLFFQALLGYHRKPERAWFFHPLACWITLYVYSWGVIKGWFKANIQDRSKWSQ